MMKTNSKWKSFSNRKKLRNRNHFHLASCINKERVSRTRRGMRDKETNTNVLTYSFHLFPSQAESNVGNVTNTHTRGKMKNLKTQNVENWDHLFLERVAIMTDAGVAEPVALAKARLDTIANHGHRPPEQK